MNQWIVVSYGSGELLQKVFNGIAMIFGNDSYAQAISVAAFLGFIGVLVKMTFDRDPLNGLRWFMGILMIYFLLIVPKTSVYIDEKIIPESAAHIKVSNVPLGLAIVASFFSQTGDFLTKQFETIFSDPGQVTYSTSGLLFPQKLYEATQKFGFEDTRTNNNFGQFFSSCVIVDGIGHNRFTWDQMVQAPNLINFFSNNVAKHAASFNYQDESGDYTIKPCRNGFKNALSKDITSSKDNIITNAIAGDMINRFGTVDKANTKIKEEIGKVAGAFGGSQNTNNFAIQQAVINAMGEATSKLGQEVNAQSFNQYVISGAELHRLTTYQALGDIASEKLPLLRIIFEAIIYAVFPIIAMMIIVIPTKVLLGYVTALVWINLWAPVYAILHFIMVYYSGQTMSEIAAANGGGFSISANAKMIKFNADVVATTGYLATALPMITWMLVSRSGAMAASFAGRVMQGYDQSVEKGASEVTAGTGQRLGENWRMTENGAVQNSFLNNQGTQITKSGNAENTQLTQMQSSLLVSGKYIDESATAASQAYKEAVTKEEERAADYSESVQHIGSTIRSFINSHTDAQKEALGFSVDGIKKDSEVGKILEQATDAYEERMGTSFTSGVKNIASLMFSAGVNFVGFASATGKLGTESNWTWEDKEQVDMINKFQESEEFTNALEKIATYTKQESSSRGYTDADTSSDQISFALKRSEDAKDKWSESISKRENSEEAFQNVQKLSQAYSVDHGQTIVNSLMEKYNQDSNKVDNVILQAASGSQQAYEEITHAVSSYFNDPQQNLSEIDYDNAQKVVEDFSDSNKTKVGGTAEERKNNMSTVNDPKIVENLRDEVMAKIGSGALPDQFKTLYEKYKDSDNDKEKAALIDRMIHNREHVDEGKFPDLKSDLDSLARSQKIKEQQKQEGSLDWIP